MYWIILSCCFGLYDLYVAGSSLRESLIKCTAYYVPQSMLTGLVYRIFGMKLFFIFNGHTHTHIHIYAHKPSLSLLKIVFSRMRVLYKRTICR
jgi:hypothetical protein